MNWKKDIKLEQAEVDFNTCPECGGTLQPNCRGASVVESLDCEDCDFVRWLDNDDF